MLIAEAVISLLPRIVGGRKNVVWCFCFLLLGAWTASAAPIPADKPAAYPAWWFEREVIKRNDTNNNTPLWANHDYPVADDFAAANVGQLKRVATSAFDEWELHLLGGAGATITALIKSWYELEPIGGQPALPNNPASVFHLDGNGRRVPKTSSTGDDFAAVNLGQVKAVAKLFYDRLIERTYSGNYPWANGSADDFALANLGQIKKLFSFDPTRDSDGDHIPDWWETRLGLNPADPADANLASGYGIFTNLQRYQFSVPPNPTDTDSDSDGLSDTQELAFGTDPNSWDSDGDGISDSWEMQYGLNPLSAADAELDLDGDGYSNLEEYTYGMDPTDYFNGNIPNLVMLSGGYQRGTPGTVLAVPIAVSVNGGDPTASVTFAVTQGAAKISVDGLTPLDSITVLSDALDPYGTPVAQVYVHLPNSTGNSSVVEASVLAGTQRVTIATTVVGTTNDIAGGGLSFTVEDSRRSHLFYVADATGAFICASRGDDWITPTAWPCTEFFCSTTLEGSAWLIDVTYNQKLAITGTQDLVWASWEANDITLPVVPVSIYLDAHEAGYGFSLHAVPALGGPEQLQNIFAQPVENVSVTGGDGQAITASLASAITGSIGTGMEFWVTRNVDGVESPHFVHAGQGMSGQSPPNWSLIGAFEATNVPAVQPLHFRINSARTGNNLTVVLSNGEHVPIVQEGTGSLYSYDANGNLLSTLNFLEMGVTVETHLATGWHLADETTNEQFAVEVTDVFDGWVPVYVTPPAGFINVYLFGGRAGHNLKLHQLPDGYGEAEAGQPRWIDLTGATAGSTTFSGTHGDYSVPYLLVSVPVDLNPATSPQAAITIFDQTAGEESAAISLGPTFGTYDLTSWLTPLVGQPLSISTTRWYHDLWIQQPNGEERQIVKGTTQGDTSFDARGNAWWNDYWYFDGSATRRELIDYWIVDKTTGEIATGNSAGLISWISNDAPSQLVATAAGNVQIALQWQAGADPVDAFRVRRRNPANGHWQVVATVPATTTSYLDTNLQIDGIYKYKVDAVHLDGSGQLLGVSLPTEEAIAAATASQTVDSDGDGIPDWWELAHRMDPFNAADALFDFDGDGLNNLAEYLRGSDPDFFNSVPESEQDPVRLSVFTRLE